VSTLADPWYSGWPVRPRCLLGLEVMRLLTLGSELVCIIGRAGLLDKLVLEHICRVSLRSDLLVTIGGSRALIH